ncbi:MAG: tetratricopeptide (TPR) repeat protein [Granulosicoccus sp.]|jgi:tetratricopeptide (TPR) repeat protein
MRILPVLFTLLTFFLMNGLFAQDAKDGQADMTKEEKIAALKAQSGDSSTVSAPAKTNYEIALYNFQKGFNLEDARDYNGALAYYDTAIITDPNLIEAYIGRGGIKFQKIEFPSAMEDYNLAIEISEKMVEMHDYKSNIKTVLGDFEGAKVEKSKVLGLNAQLAEAYFRRGHLKRFMDDLGGGCEDIKIAKDLGNIRAKTDFQDICQ